MGRALLLIFAALAVAFMPIPKVLRAAIVAVLLIAAVVFGWFVGQQEQERELSIGQRHLDEAALWEEPAVGALRVTDWIVRSPFRYSNRWTVEATIGLASPQLDRLTGIRVTVVAHDCPSESAPVASCPILGTATAERTVSGLHNAPDPRIVLRFEFPGIPFPEGRLRLLPSITGIRR